MRDDALFGRSLRSYMHGAWRLARHIDDRKAGTVLHFTGTACFEPDGPEALIYREEGMLDTGHSTVQASQRHRWVFTDDMALVHFADGRPFHRVAVTANSATDRHECSPDLYRVAYSFENLDHWHATWHVSGPRKDYTLQSHYTRLHPVGHPMHSPPE